MSAILPPGLSTLMKTIRIKRSGVLLPKRCVVAFWHSRMLGGWWAARENAVALVSSSKDGEHLSKVLTAWKYRLVRGSSGKNGMQALAEAIETVRSGAADRLVLTPDGPRGPNEQFKRGAFIAAKELGLPLIFLRISYRDGMKLMRSWDRFEIPYPFSAIDIFAEEIDTADFPADKATQDEWLKDISAEYRSNKTFANDIR